MFSNNTKNVLQRVVKSGSVKNLTKSLATSKRDNKKHAVVSGKSITGMMSALNLQKQGYEVDIYDPRSDYSRNIQWAGRQSLIDMLHSVDPRLSAKFTENVSQPLEHGSIHLGIDGSRKVSKREEVRSPDSTRIPQTGTEMIAEKSIITMEAKRFEQMLKEYLDQIPEIKQHKGKMTLLDKDEDGNYKVLNHEAPNLIVIAEGANSETRQKLGIESVPTSDTKLQIAGIIYVDTDGKMVKHWRKEGNEIRLTGTMGTKMSGKTWIVADVDLERITPAKKYATDQKTLHDRQQKLIREEFKRLAGTSLELSQKMIDEARIEGAIGTGDILPFHLQQRISSTATAGNNLVIAGDAVGNNHWSVGGGMQIGAASHQERLKKFIKQDNELPSNRSTHLQKYSNGAISDTMAWGEVGMQDCYPTVSKHYAKQLYNDGIKDWRDRKSQTPVEAVKGMLRRSNSI